jgi:hypothetical protein
LLRHLSQPLAWFYSGVDSANSETDKQFIFNIYTELLKSVTPAPGRSATETYEDNAKRLFQRPTRQHEIAGGRR